MEAEALLDGLDDDQRLAVTSNALPLVILAPAGSGKTRVLTRRIAYRTATGATDARHVLALTFTRKAAGELTDRLGRLGLRREATAGTFHALAWSTLRTRWADQRRSPPTLLEHKARILGELAPRAAGRDRRGATAALATEIEWAKARMVTPDSYVEAARAAGRRSALGAEQVAELYAAYEHRKRRGGLVDFDDLLALCARSIEEDAAFAAVQRWRFRHLYVDELQDVNPLQLRLLEAWRGDRYDITAVGDPQQSIYGWNGAEPGFLLDVHRHWPPAHVIELRRSYRSTPEILDAAATVLRGARQPAAEVEATRAAGRPPVVVALPTDRAEAVAISQAVRLARAPGRPWGDQAVLVRTHGQTAVLAEALREAGIPHRVRGGSGFLDHPAVRRAMRRLWGTPGPLGPALADLEADLDGSGAATPEGPDDDPELAALRAEEAAAARATLEALLRIGHDHLRLDPTASAAGFASWLTATVQSEADAGPAGDAVDIATFHAAKGLEWPVVHLAGLEDGYVPIAHARTPATRAEEARLLYVAMTRAQRELRLTWAEQRTFGDKVVERARSPLLDPLVAPDRVAAVAAATSPGPPTPPVPGWDEELARHRAVLARSATPAPRAVESLQQWRATTARAARVPADTVLPDRVLHRIADAAPTTTEELAGVRGVGPIMARRFGPAILAALRAADEVASER